MSVPARIMMIADIFEALTARDRPYKARKKLSECIDIMARMSREHHIDPDLFELFLSSGVYREYANIFLLTEQIDQVDITHYLGMASPLARAVMTAPPIAVHRVSPPRPAGDRSSGAHRSAVLTDTKS